MKKLILLASLLISLITVQAQTTPAKSSHYKAAEELMLTMNMKNNIEQSMQQMLALQLKSNPALQPMESSLKAFLSKYMSWTALKDDYISIYMKEFSEKEIKDMSAFYKTETGKKLAAKQTTIMLKTAQLGQSKMQKHMGELQEMMQKGPDSHQLR
ncbi:DUF2059 domain-containing protein [Adhaeribacter aquaticus]|uniref:DUF2059 domain-containing protein n=1 Tax=Adhaeribacter aquaticus TaxID=299567 RepID=UPI0003F630A4|nr:DUF2059 domain-containing protein [Adhaeribacter aquaticus]